MSAAVTTLLDRLAAHGIIDAAGRAAIGRQTPTPWWLALMLALAAWIASLLILASFFGPLLAIADSELSRAVSGALLLAAALFLFQRHHPFTAQMALAFSLAGQALLVTAVGDGFDALLRGGNLTAVAGAGIAAGMMFPPSSAFHRGVCGLLVLGHLAWLIGPGPGLSLFGVVLVAASVTLWLARARWAAHPRASAIAAVAHAVTLVALCLAPYGNARLMTLLEAASHSGYSPAVPLIYGGGVAVVFLGSVAWLTRTAAPPLRWALLAAALLFVAVAHPAPSLVAGAAVLLAVFHACHLPWIGVTLVFAVLYLGELYFSLHISLLAKSVVVAATGALLLAARAGLKSLERSAG